MNTGDIFVWVTDQAAGHASRKKYHVYLCEAGWRENGHAFLFISKADYGGDYPIYKSDYADIFQLEVSYISCNSIVFYTDDKLFASAPEKVGELAGWHIAELLDYISASETMEQWQIKLACEALRSAKHD